MTVSTMTHQKAALPTVWTLDILCLTCSAASDLQDPLSCLAALLLAFAA